MSPNWKPLVIIGVALVALVLFIALASKFILLDSFVMLEEQSARQDTRSAIDLLDSDLATLNSKNGDWSNWDESYAFIRDGNPEFIKTNIVDNTFVELRVNLFIFVNSSGRIVFSRAFDLDKMRDLPVPPGLVRLISANGLLSGRSAPRDGTLGTVLLDEGIMMISVRPILTSKGKGEPRGTLIMGRFIDRHMLGKMAGITHQSLALQRLDDPRMTHDFREVRQLLSDRRPIVVNQFGEGSVAGYALLKDIFGKEVLMLRVEIPRVIYRQGQKTIYWFNLWFAALSLAFGGSSHLFIYNLAVSRQKRKESEDRFQAIVEQSSEGILLVDSRSGAILESNGAFREMFGYDARDLEMVTLRAINPDSSCDLEDTIRERLRKQVLFVTERRCRRKDGALLDVELRASPVFSEGIEQLCLVVHDVTAHNRLEEQLRQSQKLEAVGQLAGGVAHDFNNILSTIFGYCCLMDMELEPEHPSRHNLDQVLAAADRAAYLTNGLLSFSRKQVLEPKPVEINGIIRNTENFLGRLIGEDIEFRTVLADRPLIVIADSGQLDQVLMNLAINARDAMPHGGLLTIESGSKELDEEHMMKFGYGKPGNYAVIAVSDTGAGMDEKTRQRVFEPFFTTKEPGRGTGLGLSIVYGIVKQHKGYINVYSEPGKGTTFRIYLPLTPSTDLETGEEGSSVIPLTGAETVLVADDDTKVRRITCEVLERFGYRVIEAVDGEDAVAKFSEKEGDIALLVLDLMMPGKNGKEAYDEIRKARGDVKVLFISGYTAYVVHRQKILEEGLDFISKPLEPTAFLRKIREVLDR
ncbi:MAG: PAS domain S-box protein [Geobacter sp.]|nr:PAS domain S-box protein [Geobacter sp.]